MANATVCAFAIGAGPAQTWHADGAILDWDDAPLDLREAFERDDTIAAWNSAFDSAIWNYAMLGSPWLAPERVIDVMIQAGVSNLPTDLEGASTMLGGEGKQKDGKKLIKLFCVEGATPGEHPEEWARFLSYAAQDVEAMREVYRRTRPLPRAEWTQYHAFERINRRGVPVDLPFVEHAATLATEDAFAINRRLAELTDGVVTTVGQAKRLASWLYQQLPDAATRAALTISDDDDEDNGDDAELEFSLDARSGRLRAAVLEVKQTNGGLCAAEIKALEAVTLRRYGAGVGRRKSRRASSPNRSAESFATNIEPAGCAGQTGRASSKGIRDLQPDARRARQ